MMKKRSLYLSRTELWSLIIVDQKKRRHQISEFNIRNGSLDRLCSHLIPFLVVSFIFIHHVDVLRFLQFVSRFAYYDSLIWCWFSRDFGESFLFFCQKNKTKMWESLWRNNKKTGAYILNGLEQCVKRENRISKTKIYDIIQSTNNNEQKNPHK